MSARFNVSGVAGLVSCLVALGACDVSTTGTGPNVGAEQQSTGGSADSSQPFGFGAAGGAGFGTSGPLFAGVSVRAKSTAPVLGGTLIATRDGKTIVVADPERDAIFLVDTASHRVTPVPLSSGDEPGRVVEGPDGTVFVALRRGGALVAIDVGAAQVVTRAPVCGSPRGVAYDAKTSSVYVACRSGLLLTLGASNLLVKRSLQLDTDLRDVIVRASGLVVTRFLNAEVLVVGDDGSVSRRDTPTTEPGCGEDTVAFRALSLPGGQIAIAHQVSSDDVVQEQQGGYGFSCGGALVARALSIVDVDTPQNTAVPQLIPSAFSPGFDAKSGTASGTGSRPSSMTFRSLLLPAAAGPLDIAFDVQGTRAAFIALDESLFGAAQGGSAVTAKGLPIPTSEPAPLAAQPGVTLWVSPWNTDAPPDLNNSALVQGVVIKGQPVAVAFDTAGKWLVQSREPATLELEDGTSISLSKESHADSGHQMFHMDSGIGISCSSCHPEGGEDGHVWHFPEGLRRTLPLEGGVMERAPFHWDGTLSDMGALVGEVMVKRMSMQATPSTAQIGALGAFLDRLPALPAVDNLNASAVSRGEALFRRADVACATCHSGPQFTDNRLVDVGTGGKFVTPSLLGVGLRTSLFHDGCASNVSERFGACGGTAHGNPELLSADDKADLIAFLRSL